MSWQCDECDQAHLGPVEGCSSPGFPVPPVKPIPSQLAPWQVLGYVAELWLIDCLCEGKLVGE